MSYVPIGKDLGNHNVVGNPDMELREQERWLPIANVARLMKRTIPHLAKVSKDAKECMQECVSEFISFITSEANDKCTSDKRKTINGEDVLYLLHDLGFENYAEVLKIYLAKYREQQALKQEKGELRLLKKAKAVVSDQQATLNTDQGEPYLKPEEGLEMAYSGSPAKDVQTSDYFEHYDNAPQDVHVGLNPEIPIDDKDYRYRDFIHEETEDEPNGGVQNGATAEYY